MAKKKKYTVRVAYKVYDYYDVEATSEERAIEKALEESADDSLNDFIQEGRGEGLVTIIDGKPVEPKKPEPQYVWVFTAEQAWDGETADVIVKAFGTEEAAHKYMQSFIHDDGDESIEAYVKDKGWEVEMDEPDLYRAYNDGYYNSDHIELTITKTEVC